jgi:hypothetical protein
MKKRVNVSYLFFLLPLLFFFLVSYAKQVDDIWFLFSHGRYVLNNGFPHVDFLTMHSGLHFVMQQWGFSVILYFFYHYFGSIGVLFFIGSVNLLIVYFLHKLCMTISDDNTYFSSLITCIIDLLLLLNFIIPRPQIVTFLLLIITMYILEKYTKENSNKTIYLLPLISLVLVNCHASMWFMFFIFCMPYVAEYLIHKDKRLFVVCLQNEYASDSGGPYHEVISGMCQELQSEYLNMFIKSPNNKHDIGLLRDKFIPNPDAKRKIYEEGYEFLGKLMASSISSGEALDLNLHPIVWQGLLGNEITFYDYENIDYTFFSLINNLEKELKPENEQQKEKKRK